jgi:NAD(P)-dependent dehydrogenase (short-subunit alcohol dehydrogenase family)
MAELESLAAEARAAGGEAIPLQLDVADPVAVHEAVARAARDFGSLDMVVANAGRGDTQYGSRLTWSDVGPILDVNITGALATLVAAIPTMTAQGHGQLVGVSSLAGRLGLPASAAYSASKAALSTFLESLRLDLAPSGVRVTDVRFGFVETPMTEKRTHPRPFLWPLDKAVRTIVKRLERAPAVVSFPWQLVLATNVGRFLPVSLYDPVLTALAPRSPRNRAASSSSRSK